MKLDSMTALAAELHASSPEELRRLISDLSLPIHSAESGPVSFRRLTGAAQEELRAYEGRSLLKVLTSKRTDQQMLERLHAFGKILVAPQLPNATRRTGMIVCALALAVLVRRFQFFATPNQFEAAVEALQWMAEAKALPASLRDYAKKAADDIRTINSR